MAHGLLGNRRIRRVLIIKPSSLGDIVHALPVLADLRRALPDAHISWLINRAFAPLLEGHPLLDEAILFDRRGYGKLHRSARMTGDFIGFTRELRKRRFDLVIDLQGLFRSGFLAWASGAPMRVGFATAREMAPLFYTQRVNLPPNISHAVEINRLVSAKLGIANGAPRFPLGLTRRECDAALARMAERARVDLSRFIAVVPGARWATKQWAPERFAAVIDALHAAGRPPCVLLGAPDERDVASRVINACRRSPVDLVGATSLRELAALLCRAELVLCNDSGPMHIAAALGRPIVAVFGPTDPNRCGPYSTVARVVRTSIECAPCYQRVCSHTSCLTRVEPTTVLAAIRALDSVVFGPAPDNSAHS